MTAYIFFANKDKLNTAVINFVEMILSLTGNTHILCTALVGNKAIWCCLS